MVELSIERGDVLVEVRGWSRLWAFKRSLRFPLAHVRSVRWDPAGVRGWWKGWRLPGTHVPGRIVAGTYHQRGTKELSSVRSW